MYPELLVPLSVIASLLILGTAFVALREPVCRRLAFRQGSRRRSETVLAVIGATLGTAIIVGALIVGDTLGFSVRQTAYQTLGPIDERVTSTLPAVGNAVGDRLAPLRSDPDVDGVLNARVAQAAAVSTRDGRVAAEPRVLAWDMDLDAAARFGSASGSSGLTGPTPGAGDVVVNQPLANALNLHVGNRVVLYLYDHPHRLRVIRVVADRGVAGTGLGASVNRNAWLPRGMLDAAATTVGKHPQSVTFVSNRGGVERGADRTGIVVEKMHGALGPYADAVLVDTPKRDVLATARTTGDTLGALFLMIGSFSIIAGALLLVNIFVMLAEERKGQLGMLRAIGMRRSRLVGSFAVEGASYALVAVIPAILLGLGVGWTVAKAAAQIFRSFSANGEGLTVTFAVTATSIVNAALLGLVISMVTILVTSARISRFNIIAAIRDLPRTKGARARRRSTVAATTAAVLVGLCAIPAVAASQPESTYLLPSIAATCAIPALSRAMGRRRAITLAAAAVLIWALVAPVIRPHMFDSASMAVFVIEGSILAFSAVVLVSQNQRLIVRPLRILSGRPSEGGLAMRLAVAYPLAKRFRTGATLIMYTLITLVLVLLVEVSGVIDASVNGAVADATGGYGMRVDVSPASAQRTLSSLRTGEFASSIAETTPLVSAPALASDPGHRTSKPLHAVAVGVPDGAMSAMTFTSRLASTPTDGSVWRLVGQRPNYVVIDAFFGSTGGPNGNYFSPGDTFTLTDPVTGLPETKTIAGILSNALAFYPAAGQTAAAFPVVTSAAGVRELFGPNATTSAALLRLRPGVDAAELATRLQARYLSSSVIATPIDQAVRRLFSANIAFFRLMQGFLALGLLVGITGLGVVMVRAVRERRRTIGVLRALGFRAETVQHSFLLESGLIATEGIVLGSVLGVLTTWLLYQKSAMFEGVRGDFPIEWQTIGVLALATLLFSLAATLAPARRAAGIRPAIAVRVAD
ncbi:MAG TPA: FtsX-like permease family protein [Jatrophihabitans sp.]|nr:FtsX-like permease family protein [Jatrophihabitans sp.]